MANQGFHYIGKERWTKLSTLEGSEHDIRPRRRLVRCRSIANKDIPELPIWAHDCYVFSFLNAPAPNAWKAYPQYEEEWRILREDLEFTCKSNGLISLQFTLLDTDDAYVVDRAWYADFLWGVTTDKPAAIKAYAFSRVPLSQYAGGYRMPELLLRNPIAFERLTPRAD